MKSFATIPSSLKQRIPALDWLALYERKNLRGDALAGVIVATLLIPQAMAYALLAGLPRQVGLYASLLPLAVYALPGSSRYLSVGPPALLSLLILRVRELADEIIKAQREEIAEMNSLIKDLDANR